MKPTPVIGDTVEWTSQSGGYTKTKKGEVVQVVQAGHAPWPGQLKVGGVGFGGSRKHESYLVRVGNKAYWPIASKLKIATP